MDNHPEGLKNIATFTVLSAGEFSQWLRGTQASLRSGNGQADVPCGSCKGCCRSSMFIHIKPEETQTLERIPRALLFPAPGLPRGHMLMGYSDRGQCPMLIDDRCSIYEVRPQTCRDYDCRAFAATGVAPDRQVQPEIAQRVSEWAFDYENEAGREQHRIVKEAATFLEENRSLFPLGSLPTFPVQLALLAVQVSALFSSLKASVHDASTNANAAIARDLFAAMSKARGNPGECTSDCGYGSS